MSATAITSTVSGAAAVRRARASVALGRRRGYYRLLFDAGAVDVATFAALAHVPERHALSWLEEQLDAGVIRAVTGPSGDRDELLLPGEHVPILLGDDAGRELDAARAMLEERGSLLPEVLRELVGQV